MTPLVNCQLTQLGPNFRSFKPKHILNLCEISSEMGLVHLCLLVLVSITTAIPAIDTGVGPFTYGPEEEISDFAILTDDNLDGLPSAFTICSSTATKVFNGQLNPFQLLHSNGAPWITVNFRQPEENDIFHRLTVAVSFVTEWLSDSSVFSKSCDWSFMYISAMIKICTHCNIFLDMISHF